MISSLFLLNKLKRNLLLRREQLEQIQLRKFQMLVAYAYDNVPYYRSLFDLSGFAPSELKTIDDAVRIPVTSKLKLRSLNKDEILAKGIESDMCIEDVTSGSTGIPLHVYFTKKDYIIRSLIFIRTFMETGYKLTDRQAIVCDTRFVTNKKRWFQRMGIMRKGYIPVQLDLEKQLKIMRDFNPDYIHGYPLSISLIAEEMIRRGIDDIRPRMVCTGAELVSKRTRDTINNAFGVDMRDTYATIESGLIAWECPAHEGYHINIDSVVLEFLKDGRAALPGESGKVVVTNLHSFAMPIIRYELGDICIPSDGVCSCGNDLPLMKIIEGRVDDMVCTPAGKVVSPNSITNAMEAVEGVRQFRVIQENEETLLVKLVKGKGYTLETPRITSRILNELVGEDVKVEVEIVSEIPRELTGKIRAVISKVARAKEYN